MIYGSRLCQADAFLGVSKPQVFHFFLKQPLCCDRLLIGMILRKPEDAARGNDYPSIGREPVSRMTLLTVYRSTGWKHSGEPSLVA